MIECVNERLVVKRSFTAFAKRRLDTILRNRFMRNISLKSILNLFTIALLLFACTSGNSNKEPGKEITLRLEPKQGNPRNSEGDFIQLSDGRILFVYTHFTGGTGDNANAYLAGRYSDDKGKTWTKEDVSILSNEGGMNIMSVSLLRLDN